MSFNQYSNSKGIQTTLGVEHLVTLPILRVEHMATHLAIAAHCSPICSPPPPGVVFPQLDKPGVAQQIDYPPQPTETGRTYVPDYLDYSKIIQSNKLDNKGHPTSKLPEVSEMTKALLKESCTKRLLNNSHLKIRDC